MPTSTTNGRRRLVLGIGNPDRGDDGAGRAVLRRLREAPPEAVELAEENGEATAVLAHLDGAAVAFIIDACRSGARPGTVGRFDVGAQPLPHADFGLSTHGFGLAEALELARTLGQLPPLCVVYAIEARTFETGAPLSRSVAAAVTAVAERVRVEIASDEALWEKTHA